MNSFQHDWLDAILYARPVLKDGIWPLVHEVDTLPGNPASVYIARFEPVAKRLKVYINIPPTLPRIERIEMNLCLVAHIAHWCRTGELDNNSFSVKTHCIQLGCWHTLLNDPAVRWRNLGIQTQLDLLPYANLEDRPRCEICPQVVATGSGAIEYRSTVHNECFRYAHQTLALAVRAAKAAEATAETTGADK